MLKMIDEVSEKKKKRVSKNKKKNWSKHSDIRDVEEMLVEQRRQMRTGLVMVVMIHSRLWLQCKTGLDLVVMIHSRLWLQCNTGLDLVVMLLLETFYSVRLS